MAQAKPVLSEEEKALVKLTKSQRKNAKRRERKVREKRTNQTLGNIEEEDGDAVMEDLGSPGTILASTDHQLIGSRSKIG